MGQAGYSDESEKVMRDDASKGHARHVSELSSEAATPELSSGRWPVEADSRAMPSELEGTRY
jgi:hypothetical protein